MRRIKEENIPCMPGTCFFMVIFFAFAFSFFFFLFCHLHFTNNSTETQIAKNLKNSNYYTACKTATLCLPRIIV